MKICIPAESTIDLPRELLSEFDIKTVPFTITLGEKNGLDGVTTPEEILLAQAGIMVSLATSSSSLGLCSLLGLTINSRYKIDKSLVSSILLAYSVEDAAQFKAARLEKLSHIMRIVPEETTGEEAIRLFVDYIRQKIAKFNLPARLKDLSLSIEQLSLAVEDVRPVDIVNNLPRSMTTDDIFDFVKNAY